MRARCRDDGVAARHRRMRDCPIVRWQTRLGNRRAIRLRRASGAAARRVGPDPGAPGAAARRTADGAAKRRANPPVAADRESTDGYKRCDRAGTAAGIHRLWSGRRGRQGRIPGSRQTRRHQFADPSDRSRRRRRPARVRVSVERRRGAARRAIDPRRLEDRVGHGTVAPKDACAQPARRRRAVARQRLCIDAFIRQRRRSTGPTRACGWRAQHRHRRQQGRAATSIRDSVRHRVASERRVSTQPVCLRPESGVAGTIPP